MGNEVFSKFKKNFENSDWYEGELESYLSATLLEYVVNDAFSWDDAREGYDYWYKVNQNYLKAVL